MKDIEFEDNTDLIIAGLQKENEMLRRLVDCYSDGLEEIVMKVHAGALSSDDEIYHEIALIAEKAEDIEQSWKDDIDDYWGMNKWTYVKRISTLTRIS